MDAQQYLKMQKDQMNRDGQPWSIYYKDPVVGSYELHERHPDYDTLLFKGFDTKDKIALEYGCGPGRNLVRFAPRFLRVDGVDISEVLIQKASEHLQAVGIPQPKLYVTSGDNIPVEDNTYDVVFSVICLQHIACHSIRYKIMSDAYRVLKPNGHFCFQMALDGDGVPYHTDYFNAPATNGAGPNCDVHIENEQYLKDDLSAIGFRNYISDVGVPVADRKMWIWVQVQK
jgi:SAM-dependent methyltransferase